MQDVFVVGVRLFSPWLLEQPEMPVRAGHACSTCNWGGCCDCLTRTGHGPAFSALRLRLALALFCIRRWLKLPRLGLLALLGGLAVGAGAAAAGDKLGLSLLARQ